MSNILHNLRLARVWNYLCIKVGTATRRRAGRRRDRGESAGGLNSFLLCKLSKTILGFIHWIKRITSPGLMRPQREADQLSPSSGKANNAWDTTSSLQYVFVGRNTLWLLLLSSAVQWGSSSQRAVSNRSQPADRIPSVQDGSSANTRLHFGRAIVTSLLRTKLENTEYESVFVYRRRFLLTSGLVSPLHNNQPANRPLHHRYVQISEPWRVQ
jgi:hypothetical protein